MHQPAGLVPRNGMPTRRLQANELNMPVGRVMVLCVNLLALSDLPGAVAPKQTDCWRLLPDLGSAESSSHAQSDPVYMLQTSARAHSLARPSDHGWQITSLLHCVAPSGSRPVPPGACSSSWCLECWTCASAPQDTWLTEAEDVPARLSEGTGRISDVSSEGQG